MAKILSDNWHLYTPIQTLFVLLCNVRHVRDREVGAFSRIIQVYQECI